MRLTRRDALIALAAVGGTATAAGTLRGGLLGDLDDGAVVDRLHAVAEAIYPSAVEVDRDFVETYVYGRLTGREAYLRDQVDALEALDTHSRRLAGRSIVALSSADRLDVLTSMGVHRAHPNPSGTLEERVRYYVVNDLLYALFSTPVGGELVGCENPPGHPGGREAYQRPPPE